MAISICVHFISGCFSTIVEKQIALYFKKAFCLLFGSKSKKAFCFKKWQSLNIIYNFKFKRLLRACIEAIKKASHFCEASKSNR